MPAASRTQSYSPIEGSERALPAAVKLLGPADPDEVMSVTVFLRQRPDGEPLPDFSYYATTPAAARPRLSDEEFAALYGASDDDIARVVEFARSHGLSVVESHAARRTIVVRGTVSQMSRAFHVELRRYEHSVRRRRHEDPRTEEFRGREGAVYVPDDLSGVIVGVFGLDNRRITKGNTGDPPNTRTITVPRVRGLYNFPTNSAGGQTIAIFSERGYQKQDIANYFASLPSGYPAPTITDVSVGASNDGSADPETTQDICIAATAAPGAEIVVYFTSYTQQGWVDLFMRSFQSRSRGSEVQCAVLELLRLGRR